VTSYSGVEHFPDIQKFTGNRVHFPKCPSEKKLNLLNLL
jgi:hypothetical protein